MKRALAVLPAALAATTAPAEAPAVPVSRDEVIAFLTLDVDRQAARITPASWNGRPLIFADYVTGDEDRAVRPLVFVYRGSDRGLDTVKVTTGEPEGGTAEIAAISFANADKDPAKELIVILTWNQRHYDINGALFEVRLFDDWKPGTKQLTPLKLSAHFGFGCECSRREGPDEHYRYQKIAAVRKELTRLGY